MPLAWMIMHVLNFSAVHFLTYMYKPFGIMTTSSMVGNYFDKKDENDIIVFSNFSDCYMNT